MLRFLNAGVSEFSISFYHFDGDLTQRHKGVEGLKHGGTEVLRERNYYLIVIFLHMQK
jgi:hypothetical protein